MPSVTDGEFLRSYIASEWCTGTLSPAGSCTRVLQKLKNLHPGAASPTSPEHPLHIVGIPVSHIRWHILSGILVGLVVSPSVSTGAKPGASGEQGVPTNPGPVSSTGRRDASGIARALYRLSSPPSALPPEETARRFLRDALPALGAGLTETEFRTARVACMPGGSHVRFEQYVAGVPVLDADLVVSMDGDGRVVMLVNNVEEPPSEFSAFPTLSAHDAIRSARNVLETAGPAVGIPESATLMAWRSEQAGWHLVYRVLLTLENPPGDWEVLLDAKTGAPLRINDRFVMHSESTASVPAAVYTPDPLSTARRLYGSPGFADNNDADTDSLLAARTMVRLDSLTVAGTMITLSGPWCSVVDIEAPAGPPVYGAENPADFVVPRSSQMFEAVNAYYHASLAARHVETLGFQLPGLRSLRLDPHGFQGQDNSHYSPSGHWIGFGEGGVDDAEDADIIWHEYAHAVIFTIIPTWGGGESGALGEGIADYWAASASRETEAWTPGDYHRQWIFNWDGHNPFWAGRILNDSRVYPFGPLPIHSAGQIVCAGLMGIREELGRTITDRLVLKALMYLGARTMAADFGHAMIQADEDLYDGAHLPVIAYWLGTVKKFIDPSPYVLAVEEEQGVPAAIGLGQNYPNPFNPATRIPFRLAEGGGVVLRVVDIAGREVGRPAEGAFPAGEHTVTWDAGGLPSGVYILRLELHSRSGARAAATRKVMLLR